MALRQLGADYQLTVGGGQALAGTAHMPGRPRPRMARICRDSQAASTRAPRRSLTATLATPTQAGVKNGEKQHSEKTPTPAPSC